MSRKKIAWAGIILCCIYFLVVIFFIMFATTNWLITFEIVTMISGVYFVFLIICLPSSKEKSRKICKTAAIIFVSALMLVTAISHSISLTVIQLLKSGITIPEYFQIGKTPSIITSIEYLGWGIFMGLSFLFSSFGIEKEQKQKPLKITLLVCAILCFLGYFGWLLNENLWYIASAGYGIGTIVICVQILLSEKKHLINNDYIFTDK